MSEETSSNGRRRCCFVMGFVTKTAYATGRKLGLDKSYRPLVKPYSKCDCVL